MMISIPTPMMNGVGYGFLEQNISEAGDETGPAETHPGDNEMQGTERVSWEAKTAIGNEIL